ncbi:hypothetical protein DL96DRAFT_1716959 [Flagelloscypha sp. PMI_526]|nr:hypothetical protein DL96DRAFT_1716959 [Flagelloscypha sp. PMI_526]
MSTLMKIYRPCSPLDDTPYRIWTYEEGILSIQAKRRSPRAIRPFLHRFRSGFSSSPLPQSSPHLSSSQTLTRPAAVSSLMLVILQTTSLVLANANLQPPKQYQIDALMLPLQYGLLGGGNALSYLWEPGLALFACRTVPPSLVLRYLTTSRSTFYERRLSLVLRIPLANMVQTLASLHRTASTSVKLLLEFQTQSPDDPAVANEPVPRASTSSSPASSSDSSPSLPLRSFRRLCSKGSRRGIGGWEPVPSSVLSSSPNIDSTSPRTATSPVPLAGSPLGVFQATNQMRAYPSSAPSSLQTILNALQTQLQASATPRSSGTNASAGAHPVDHLPELHPAPRPPPPALASSSAVEIGPLPVTKLPFPPPVPGVRSPPKLVPLAMPLSSPPASSMQATSIGQNESIIEKDNPLLIKRGMLPLPDTTDVTGMGSLTTWWKGLAWTVRPVEDVE